MQKDRDLSFDAFRGVAIIAVVAIHSWRCPTTGWWNPFFIVTYRQLLNFAVPVFVFISGYWLSKKQIKSLHDYKTFLIRRLSRVLIPYLFWSLVLIGYEAAKTHDVDVYRIILKLLTGGVVKGYFFIILITQLYIITPLLQYINSKSYGLILVLIFNTLSLLVLYLSRVFNVIGYVPAALPFYSWVVFYEIGLLLGGGARKISVPKNMRYFILPAVFVTLLISGLETSILLSKYNNLAFANSAVKYSSFLYSVCIIAGFLFLRERVRYWPKLLVTIGNYSFGIYLIHILILDKVVNFVQKANIIYSFTILYELVVVSITIAICIILISITRKLLPQSFCTKVLGF